MHHLHGSLGYLCFFFDDGTDFIQRGLAEHRLNVELSEKRRKLFMDCTCGVRPRSHGTRPLKAVVVRVELVPAFGEGRGQLVLTCGAADESPEWKAIACAMMWLTIPPSRNQLLNTGEVLARHHRDMAALIFFTRSRISEDAGVVGVLKQTVEGLSA